MRTVDFTGTVSQATIKTCDLVPAFWNILVQYHPEAACRIDVELLDADLLLGCNLDKWIPDDDDRWQSEAMSWIRRGFFTKAYGRLWMRLRRMAITLAHTLATGRIMGTGG